LSAKYTEAGGAVLAGGNASRFDGVDKAFVELDGVPLIRRVLNTLRRLFDEILIVTNSPEEFTVFEKECLIVSDIIKDRGPLGGIHSALSHTSKEKVFVTACDMPFINPGFIEKLTVEALTGGYDCVIPKSASGIEPLCGVYAKRLEKRAETLLRGGDYSVRLLMDKSRCKYVEACEEETGSFVNINAPEVLKKYGRCKPKY